MVGSMSLKKWNVKDLFFESFVVVDTVGCDKEREKLGGLLFNNKCGCPCSCPCPNPCGCPVQRK